MQKVYIRGVKGRGKEVIAKLEALGGKNVYKFSGNNPDVIYLIGVNGNIYYAAEELEIIVLMWAGTEIFLDEPIERKTPTDIVFNLYQKVRIKKDGAVSEVRQRLRDIDDETVVYVLDNLPNTMFHTNELEEVRPEFEKDWRTTPCCQDSLSKLSFIENRAIVPNSES